MNEGWECESDSYDETSGTCMCDGNPCSGFECPYDMCVRIQYINTDNDIEKGIENESTN
jgi:hypothetical protein